MMLASSKARPDTARENQLARPQAPHENDKQNPPKLGDNVKAFLKAAPEGFVFSSRAGIARLEVSVARPFFNVNHNQGEIR